MCVRSIYAGVVCACPVDFKSRGETIDTGRLVGVFLLKKASKRRAIAK